MIAMEEALIMILFFSTSKITHILERCSVKKKYLWEFIAINRRRNFENYKRYCNVEFEGPAKTNIFVSRETAEANGKTKKQA